MADPILNNTLTGTLPTELPVPPKGLTTPQVSTDPKQISQSVKTLEGAQADPTSLVKFNQVMQLASSQAYKERQAEEMKVEGGLFNPSEVSGGTFAAIIGSIEGRRGADISKVYASTMNTYNVVQQQITDRLEFLQQLQETRRQFDLNYKLEKKRIKIAGMSEKAELKRLKEEKRQFDLNYQLTIRKYNNSRATADLLPYTSENKALWNSRNSAVTGNDASSSGPTYWSPSRSNIFNTTG